jgi:hypothetical protein
VFREHQRLKKLRLQSDAKIDSVPLMMRKRLLYLFVKDLSSGVSGAMLSSKDQRDSQMSRGGSVSRKIDRVSWQRKGAAGLFVALLDIGMLIYVYLFAMNQTSSRQEAWFISFVMWLGFEIFLSSTALVLVLHLLVPLYVWSDVAEVKKKVLTDLMKFREKYLKRDGNDIESGLLGVDPGRGGGGETGGSFNAAKFLFLSWRVASLFPELPESRLVLQFSTLFPQKKFGKEEEGNVAKEYEDDVLLTAASRILLYFLTSLLHYSSLVQDILIQTVCNGSLGYVIFLLVQLWKIYPWLFVVAVLVLLLCVYGLGQYSLRGLTKKLQEVQEEEKMEMKIVIDKCERSHLLLNKEQRELSPPASVLEAPVEAPRLEISAPSTREVGSLGLVNIRSVDDDQISLGGFCMWESEESSSEGDPSIVRFSHVSSDASHGSQAAVGSESSSSNSESIEVTVVRVKKLRKG